MDSRRKLQAIRARLGEPRVDASRKGEWGFLCPNPKCATQGTGKAKLFVNPETDRFHCWVCGFGNRGSLAPLMVRGSAEQREYLESRGDERRIPLTQERPPCTGLPEDFTPFALSGSPVEAMYLSYLTGRGLSERTVALYRMGYVETGRLAGRVVVPSFDAVGSVNFWSARRVHDHLSTPPYILPDASKDMISNEHMVDWTRPVYLVEGIFDEIAIGPQAIALYGKFMQPKLALRLVERRPPMVHVCLDSDARMEGLVLMKRLVGYDLRCSLLDLRGKDPGVVGRDGVDLAVSESVSVTGSAGLIHARGI